MSVTESEVRELVSRVLEKYRDLGGSSELPSRMAALGPEGGEFPIEASARHVHLTVQAVEALFGPGARLTKKRDLSQPGEFLSDQRVRLVTAKGELANVAVLGPERSAVQVELSLTDARTLGVRAPVNLSGDLSGAGNVTIIGEKGMLTAPGSVIAAKAHIHMTPADASRFGVKDGEVVRVRAKTARPVTFDQVVIRVKSSFSLAMHIDFDEANACALGNGGLGVILREGRDLLWRS